MLGIALGVLAVWWWASARRAEAPAPPATAAGARMIGQPPTAEEITAQEKEEMQRILREHGAGSGAKAE